MDCDIENNQWNKVSKNRSDNYLLIYRNHSVLVSKSKKIIKFVSVCADHYYNQCIFER